MRKSDLFFWGSIGLLITLAISTALINIFIWSNFLLFLGSGFLTTFLFFKKSSWQTRLLLSYPLSLSSLPLIYFLSFLNVPIYKSMAWFFLILFPVIGLWRGRDEIKSKLEKLKEYFIKVKQRNDFTPEEIKFLRSCFYTIIGIAALLFLIAAICSPLLGQKLFPVNGDFNPEMNAARVLQQQLEKEYHISNWRTDVMAGYPPYQHEGFLTYLVIGLPNYLFSTNILQTVGAFYFFLLFLPPFLTFILLRSWNVKLLLSLLGAALLFTLLYPLISSGQMRHIALVTLFLSGFYSYYLLMKERQPKYLFLLTICFLFLSFSISRAGLLFFLLLLLSSAVYLFLEKGLIKKWFHWAFIYWKALSIIILLCLTNLFWLLPFLETKEYLSPTAAADLFNNSPISKMLSHFQGYFDMFSVENNNFSVILAMVLLTAGIMIIFILKAQTTEEKVSKAFFLALVLLPLIYLLIYFEKNVALLGLERIIKGRYFLPLAIIPLCIFINKLKALEIGTFGKRTKWVYFGFVLIIILILSVTIPNAEQYTKKYITNPLSLDLKELKIPYLQQKQDYGRINLYGAYFAPYLLPFGIANNHPAMEIGIIQSSKSDFLYKQRDYYHTFEFPFSQNLNYTLNSYWQSYTKYILLYKCSGPPRGSQVTASLLKSSGQFRVTPIGSCLDLYEWENLSYAEEVIPYYINVSEQEFYTLLENKDYIGPVDPVVAKQYNLTKIGFIGAPKQKKKNSTPITVHWVNSEKLTIQGNFSAESWIVLRENYFPYWKAENGHNEVPVYEANTGIILIKPGQGQEIILNYETPFYQKVLVLLSLIILTGAFLFFSKN